MNAHTGTVVGHSFWFNNWGCTVDRYPLQLRANLTVTERIPSKCKTPAPANYTVRALTHICEHESSYPMLTVCVQCVQCYRALLMMTAATVETHTHGG